MPVNDDTIDEDDETFTVTLSGVSSNAQLAADPTAKGTILDDDDDCPHNTTTTCSVDVGGSATGTNDNFNDFDWFRVDLVAGTRYQVDLEGAPTERGTLANPAVSLRDAAATNLASDATLGRGQQRPGDLHTHGERHVLRAGHRFLRR